MKRKLTLVFPLIPLLAKYVSSTAVRICMIVVVCLIASAAFLPTKNARAASTPPAIAALAASCNPHAGVNIPNKYTWQSRAVKAWTTCKGTQLHLQFQNDGNFVLYAREASRGGWVWRAIWASSTSVSGHNVNHPGTFWKAGKGTYVTWKGGQLTVVLWVEGFLPTQPYHLAAVWHVPPSGPGGSKLVLQYDGNIVISNAKGKAIWASGTYTY